MVIFCRNSLYSIISLVFLIIGCCFILFSLKVEFLTLILLLIYIGAISVLFLFIVMMLKLNNIEKQLNSNFNRFSKNYLIYTLLSIKLSCFILFFNKNLSFSLSFFSFEFLKQNKDINNSALFLFENQNDSLLFLSLFNQNFLFFIVIGFILLFSMIGSISLCLIKNK
jgi:NADH:ubiquinone oxidoreductase subunit 6 (subunit J)